MTRIYKQHQEIWQTNQISHARPKHTPLQRASYESCVGAQVMLGLRRSHSLIRYGIVT